jgi:Family of unknown function (DUF5709)
MDDAPEYDEYAAANDSVGAGQLTPSDTLTGDDRLDALDAGYSPPDREPRALRHGVTVDEEIAGESLADKLAEEEPDISDAADDEDTDFDEADPIAGRLVRPDDEFGVDNEADEIGSDGGWGGESAEEAAIHIEEV